MKRGLKDLASSTPPGEQPGRCKDYPDEKGTERKAAAGILRRAEDARITPMKRGLKVEFDWGLCQFARMQGLPR